MKTPLVKITQPRPVYLPTNHRGHSDRSGLGSRVLGLQIADAADVADVSSSRYSGIRPRTAYGGKTPSPTQARYILMKSAVGTGNE